MGTQWAREEAKRNELAVWLERLGLWVQANREISIGAILAVVALALGGVYFISRQSKAKAQAWERLAIAQSAGFQGQVKPALELFDRLVLDYPESSMSAYALLYKGDLLYRQALYKEAVEPYRMLLAEDPTGSLAPFALANLCLAHEAAGSLKEAVSAGSRLLSEQGDHFLAPQAHACMARAFLAMGEKEQAKSTYEKIALLYPDTSWSKWAQSKLK